MMESIVLGGGCFWCTEGVFRRIKGVESVVSGYSGGNIENPTYEQVSTGNTGHAEVIKIEYDPAMLNLDIIFEIFFKTHDPTTLNKQGNDIGTQYRSVIFYSSDEQKNIAENFILKKRSYYDVPIVTEVFPLKEFYAAEEYHQNYLEKNPFNGYCMYVAAPKVMKAYENFDKYIKDEYKD